LCLTMRLLAVKSIKPQARVVAFRRIMSDATAYTTHQCTTGHLAEYALVAPNGPTSLKVLENALADETNIVGQGPRSGG
jgi:transposase